MRTIREARAVTGRARHPRQEVEIEQAWFDAKPVVVPSAVEAEAPVGGSLDREVAEVPIDEDGDLRPLVVANFDEAFEKSVGVLPQHSNAFGREVEVARGEGTLEEIEEMDGVTLDGLRRARQQRGDAGARQVELGDLGRQVRD